MAFGNVTPMYDIITWLAGEPTNSYEHLMNHFTACVLTVLFVYAILALFQSFVPRD